MSDATRSFLGSGWKFPPRLDSRGRIELVELDADIEESIRIILMTRKGERPMRPEFGSELHTLVFAPNNPATCGLARRFVTEALTRWEPRIELQNVDAEPDENHPERMMISISYRSRQTNSERNLVFPFYTIPGEE